MNLFSISQRLLVLKPHFILMICELLLKLMGLQLEMLQITLVISSTSILAILCVQKDDQIIIINCFTQIKQIRLITCKDD